MKNKKSDIEKNLIKDFNLPNYIKNKSFADASKAINNKFKDRQDVYATKTKEELLERLANAQEYVKMQSDIGQQSQTPDLSQTLSQPGQMGSGGFQLGTVDNAANPDTVIAGNQQENQLIDGTKDAVAGVLGPFGMVFRGVQKAGQGLGNTVGGDVGAGIADLFSPEESTASIFTTNKDASWDEKVALTMPIVGGIANKRLVQRRKHEQDMKNAYIKNNQYDNNFADGGYIDKNKEKDKNKKSLQQNVNAATGINFDEATANRLFEMNNSASNSRPTQPQLDLGRYKNTGYFDVKNQDSNYIVAPTKANPQNAQGYNNQVKYLQGLNPNAKLDPQAYQQFNNRMMYGGYGEGETYPQPKNSTAYSNKTNIPFTSNVNMQSEDVSNIDFKAPFDWSKFGKKAGGVAMGAMALAPAIGNLFTKIDKPNTAKGARLDNRYNRQLFDEQAMQNIVNQNNLQGALSANSGGDIGALRSNIIAGNLSKTKALSDAYLKGSEVNRGENELAQKFNLGVDQTNINQEERYIERKAQDEGAYNSAKIAKRNAILENIGSFGKEAIDKGIVTKMFGYKWNGEYYVDKDGKKVSSEDVIKAEAAAKAEQNKTS